MRRFKDEKKIPSIFHSNNFVGVKIEEMFLEVCSQADLMIDVLWILYNGELMRVKVYKFFKTFHTQFF